MTKKDQPTKSEDKENSLYQQQRSLDQTFSESTHMDDINKVYIPFRPILEMELALSSLMAKDTYDNLAKLLYTERDTSYIIKELEISPDSVYPIIFDRFFQKSQNLVPLASYYHDLSKGSRYGNVNAYTKSRVPIFFAIDRLKFKLLLLRNFLEFLISHNYLLSEFPAYSKNKTKTFEEILFSEYKTRMQDYFETMTWEHEHQSKYIKEQSKLNYNILSELNKFQIPDKMNAIYIMRSIRASYLVAKILFKLMDVEDCFIVNDEPIEPIILNRDIIPGVIIAINQAYSYGDSPKLHELVPMFTNYLNWMLKGVDYGYNIASLNQLVINPNSTLYYSGKITKYQSK